jgi:hypothetical protein
MSLFLQDPEAICVELNMCDQKSLQTIERKAMIPSDNVINVNC